ncbi:MAG: hypothetical protein ACRCWQ_04935 [Bacilli bacterium]
MYDVIGSVLNGKIVKKSDEEIVIKAGSVEAVLRNGEECPFEEGDAVRAFIYNEHLEVCYATLEIPKVTVGRYDFCEIVRIDETGEGVIASIDAKLEVLVGKDDLPSFEPAWPQVGDKIWMTIKASRGGNLYGKPAPLEVIRDTAAYAKEEMLNKDITGYTVRPGEIGTHILTEEGILAFIHISDRTHDMRLGEVVSARITNIQSDGTVNASMKPRAHERMDDDAEKIIRILMARTGGTMPFGDKSDPYDIDLHFGMSKGSFKRALGRLMKAGKVTQVDGWTTLVKEEV